MLDEIVQYSEICSHVCEICDISAIRICAYKGSIFVYPMQLHYVEVFACYCPFLTGIGGNR